MHRALVLIQEVGRVNPDQGNWKPVKSVPVGIRRIASALELDSGAPRQFENGVMRLLQTG